MNLAATLRGTTYRFTDVKDVLAKANEEKSGDRLAGIAAASVTERVAAKLALADVRLAEIAATPLVDDDVTALVEAAHDREAFAGLASLTAGELRELVLGPDFPTAWAGGLA